MRGVFGQRGWTGGLDEGGWAGEGGLERRGERPGIVAGVVLGEQGARARTGRRACGGGRAVDERRRADGKERRRAARLRGGRRRRPSVGSRAWGRAARARGPPSVWREGEGRGARARGGWSRAARGTRRRGARASRGPMCRPCLRRGDDDERQSASQSGARSTPKGLPVRARGLLAGRARRGGRQGRGRDGPALSCTCAGGRGSLACPSGPAGRTVRALPAKGREEGGGG